MDNQTYTISADTIPKVIVTEPSPLPIQNESVGSLARKIETITEVSSNGAPSESVKRSLEQSAANQEASANLPNGEFFPAQDCNECVVPVIDESSAQQLDSASTATPEPEQDNFRSPDIGCCTYWGNWCINSYLKAWDIVHDGYALMFWMPLMALPISGALMGTLFMYRCPAAHNLPMLMFTICISLIAVIMFRVCLIIRRLITTAEDDRCNNMLRTLMLISSFFSILFFITESTAFWKMEPSTEPDTEYCHPTFVTYSFWFNCIMCVAMVPIFLFPV